MAASLSAPRQKTKIESPASRLLAWWDVHRRALPWRAEAGEAADPYAVWLSEILLQQTTVAAATPYFNRFMALWPRVEDLGRAPLEEVMRVFAGLGYYSRARNLHACAREIAGRGGIFPDDEAGLRKLPGVGAYTAAAIAAIAFDRPASPVDGNIARIIARLRALPAPIARSRGEIAAVAVALTPPGRPGDFAQAMMDLGATICTPRSPSCLICPIRTDCAAFAGGAPEEFPRREAKAARPLRKGAAFFARTTDGRILLRTRPSNGLLGGTAELPGGGWSVDFEPAEAMALAPFAADWRRVPGLVVQAFTHFTLELTVYAARASAGQTAGDGYWVAETNLGAAALSSVMAKAIAHALRYEKAAPPPADGAPNTRRNAPSTKRPSAPIS